MECRAPVVLRMREMGPSTIAYVEASRALGPLGATRPSTCGEELTARGKANIVIVRLRVAGGSLLCVWRAMAGDR